APEARDQVADERRGDDHRSRADHSDGDGNQEIPLAEPLILLDDTLLQERDDHEAAAEGESAGLEEEQEQLAEGGSAGGGRDSEEGCYGEQPRGRGGGVLPEPAVVEDADDPCADE